MTFCGNEKKKKKQMSKMRKIKKKEKRQRENYKTKITLKWRRRLFKGIIKINIGQMLKQPNKLVILYSQ